MFRQFIGSGVELEDKSNTTELYELESQLEKNIEKVVEWRVKHLKEKEWEQAVPQTLLTILEGWDRNASRVACRCFLEIPARSFGQGIEEEIK